MGRGGEVRGSWVEVGLCVELSAKTGAAVAERPVVWMRGQLGTRAVVGVGGSGMGKGSQGPWVWYGALAVVAAKVGAEAAERPGYSGMERL